jgi:hypothetical protein
MLASTYESNDAKTQNIIMNSNLNYLHNVTKGKNKRYLLP